MCGQCSHGGYEDEDGDDGSGHCPLAPPLGMVPGDDCGGEIVGLPRRRGRPLGKRVETVSQLGFFHHCSSRTRSGADRASRRRVSPRAVWVLTVLAEQPMSSAVRCSVRSS